MSRVVFIIDKLDKQTQSMVLQNMKDLAKFYANPLTIKFLDTRYQSDYLHLYETEKNFVQAISNEAELRSLYINQYFVSQDKGNVNGYTNEFVNNRKLDTLPKNKRQQVLMKQNDDVVVAVNYDATGKLIKSVDFANPGQKNPSKRALVNRVGNIQIIRYFDELTKKPLQDDYVDTQLNPFMRVGFDEKGLRASYEFLNFDTPPVRSELDLYEQWFKQEIATDDIIVNYHRDFDIIFESFNNQENIYLVSL